MNPQHIVYLGIILVGIPLKPKPDEFGLYSTDYFVEPVFVEAGADYKIEMIAEDIYRFTAYPCDDWCTDNNDKIRNDLYWNIEVIPDSAVVSGIVCEDGHVEHDINNMSWNGVYYEC